MQEPEVPMHGSEMVTCCTSLGKDSKIVYMLTILHGAVKGDDIQRRV